MLINHKKYNNFFVAAQNGTGKTLSYLIPIIQELKLLELEQNEINTKPQRPSALIIVPSKELSI